VNLRRQRRDDVEVNLTPLIDVVFLLLIFFMVSTTFKHDAQLQVQLPQASAKPVEQNQQSLELVIDVKGHYFINDKEVINTRPETLKRALDQAAQGRNKDLPLVIRADAHTPYQAVVTAMDVAGQLGFVHLSVATVQPDKP